MKTPRGPLLLAFRLALACAGFAAVSAPARPLVTTYDPRETGGSGLYWTGVQDAHGELFFGCDTVLQFDGERWQQHPVPGSYGVRALAIGRDSRLWVGATNQIGYFERTPTGALSSYRSLIPQLPANTPEVGDVWQVFARDGGAVFVTSDAVLIWDGRQFHTHRLPGARRLAAMKAGDQIYIGHASTGIWRLEGDELVPFVPATRLHGEAAVWMDRTSAGWLILTNGGAHTWTGSMLDSTPSPLAEFIRGNVVTSVCHTAGGRLCVGTLNHGVAVFTKSGNLDEQFDAPDTLPSSGSMFVFGDRDGALWIGSSVGLARVVPGGSVSAYDRQDGLTGRPCRRLSESDGRLVVATDNGAFQMTDGPASRFVPVPALPGYYFDVLADAGGIYAAGYHGVVRWDGHAATPVYSTRSDVFVFRRSHGQPGTFLLADEDRLVRLVPTAGGGFDQILLAHLPDSPLEIVEDETANVWVGSRSGTVFRVPSRSDASAPRFEAVNKTPTVGPALVARLGAMVAAFTGDGLTLYDTDSRPRPPVPGLPARGAIAVSNTTDDGAVWVAYGSPFADGERLPVVGRLTVDQEGTATWQPCAIEGLNRIGGINTLHVDAHGVLWIGGPDGLLRVALARLKPAPRPFTPVIRSSLGAGDTIPYHSDPVVFEFGSVQYARREALRFQTRLSASDTGWSEPRNADQVALAGLRDGPYEFAVRAINDAGLASEPARWRFTVLPPWYRTNLAYAGWAVLAVLGFWGGIQWRSAYLRRQNARLQALVERKTAQLEKANAAKSDFLANMSHEIRNPISGIVGLSLAMEETALDERQRQLTDSIRNCAGLLATLVDDVLDFAKIEAGRIELRPAPFELRASLEQCAAMVAEDARVARCKVSLLVAPDLPPRVVGDAARVQQIVLNYLSNAVKFGPGRPVTVEATPGTPGQVRLAVCDQGPGMTEAEAATLFTKFTRLDPARTGNIRGTGLGLAVCKLLTEKMGGTVGVNSTPGAGSCFWAELPLPAATAGAPAEPAQTAVAPHLRALIVEDIPYNAAAMQAVLRKLHIDSDVAPDGPTALQRLESTAYDVAFMDWSLPGMIGTEVVRRYRAVEPANRRTIIIATTAYSGEFNREACLAAGMDAFIAKPFTPEKIAAALRDLRGSLRAAASVVVSPAAGAADGEIDLQMLRFLADDSPERLAAEIQRYLETFETDRRAFGDRLSAADGGELHRIAHRLVSHASAVKYEPLIRLAAALQAQAGSADREALVALFAQFEDEFARFRGKLDAIRSSPGPA